MTFSNVNLDYPNFTFGPVAGQVYSFDHVSDTLVVKTFPGGSLISTLPLDTDLPNEVQCAQYDGYYFWTLTRLGVGGALGNQINKWKISGSTVVKQTGVGNEIPLINSVTKKYDSEALSIQRYETSLTSPTSPTTVTISVGSTTFIEIGDVVYVGPLGSNMERSVIGFTGSTITLSSAVGVSFSSGAKVIYRKNIWLFNNKNNNADDGSLVQISSYNGSIISTYSSAEWKHVTTADCLDGNLILIRNSQILSYKPFGANAGYQFSAFLTGNSELDNTTPIPAYDMAIDSSTVYKLQKKRRIFNGTSFEYEIETSALSKYEIDTEVLAPRVISLTAQRLDVSNLLGASKLAHFKIKLKSQYDISVLGRSVSVTENDTSGFISPGFTSFTTDANGEGLTQYDTGANPGFSTPTIKAIDILTNLRINTLVEQYTNVSDITEVVQTLIKPTSISLEQRQLLFSTQITQRGQPVGISYVEQQSYQDSVTVEQTRKDSSLQIVQDIFAESFTEIVQGTDVSGTTNVQQFQFLVFSIPAPYSIKNPPDTSILVRIIGFGATPLNSSTLIFKVNGFDVTSSVVVSSFAGGLQLDYNPPVDFDYSSQVSIFISIQDTNSVPRTVSTFYIFNIIGDFRKPFVSEVFPPDRSIGNDKLTEVYAILKDQETGINVDSIKMYVDGLKVPFTTAILDNETVKVSFIPTEPFFFMSDVYASIYVEDNESNKLVYTWQFQIQTSSGALFINLDPKACDVLVPVTTDICGEVYGLEQGVNLKTLKQHVDGKEVVYLLKPKVYRAE